MEAIDVNGPESGSFPADDRARLERDVEAAARLIAPMWPLEGFVAVNPLMGLQDLGFAAAVREAERWLPIRGYPPPAFMKAAHDEGRITDADLAAVLAERHLDSDETLPALRAWLRRPPPGMPAAGAPYGDAGTAAAIDAQWAAFCAGFTDAGAADWALPDRSGGFYRCWRAAAAHDPLLGRRAAAAVAALPPEPADALLAALTCLGVPEARRVEEMRGRLARLPGWAGYARWRQDWAGPDSTLPELRVLDLLAVRFSYEAILLGPSARGSSAAAPGPAPNDALGPEAEQPQALLWLEAYERHYRDDLLPRLSARRAGRASTPPRAQVVFCIDARSERFRRGLEAVGPYETFGFAGFFGFPVAIAGLGDREASARCPVLMAPQATVRERPAPDRPEDAVRRLGARARQAALHDAWRTAKLTPGAAFPLAEWLGWWLWAAASLRTAWPRPSRDVPAATVLDAADDGGLSLDERSRFAQGALTAMGLTQNFSPLVVLCGHRGQTAANPHASSLDCGACAGAAGGPSARVAAAALNEPAIRAALGERGILIPADTWFVAAEHNTTTDDVVLLDRHRIPAHHQARLARLAADLAEAGTRCAAERVASLPGFPAFRSPGELAAHLARRAADWAQVRPEWGLARNAAFVVGPRALTAGCDLEGRVFLHSYEPDLDPDGATLEGILAGPLVVAQWINAQYYFSSVAPEVFGAGDKTLHNPVGGMGVLCGEGRDLRAGLPWQSVAVGQRLHHEPMRLLAVVQAPLERLEAVIARNTAIRELVEGRWLHLVAGPGDGSGWWVRRSATWSPWVPAGPRRTGT